MWARVSHVSTGDLDQFHARNAGYLLSIWKLASRSAVRLAVGDEPRTGRREK